MDGGMGACMMEGGACGLEEQNKGAAAAVLARCVAGGREREKKREGCLLAKEGAACVGAAAVEGEAEQH